MSETEELQRLHHVELLLRFEAGGDLETAIASFDAEYARFVRRVLRFAEAHEAAATGG